MTLFLIVILLVAGLVILLDLAAWQLLLHNKDATTSLKKDATTSLCKDATTSLPEDLPEVAVLVAARNEEANLDTCLQCLLQLDYPPRKLHILVGDDASTDETFSIAHSWSQKHTQIKVYPIEENLGLARGKANVLAQLAHACHGEVAFLFITDADTRPHPQWIRRMLASVAPGVGGVSGTTLVVGTTRWARWQQTDWALGLGMAKAYTYLPGLGRALTVLGNNLLLSRAAYQATGGFETIPFSITEDYEILQQLYRRGYSIVHLMDEQSSATTAAVPGFSSLLHQRKRWMSGAMRLPPALVFLLVVQALFFPAILVLLWLQPLAGLTVLLLKTGLQFLLARQVLGRVCIKQQPAAGFFYIAYTFIINMALLVFYLLPIKISWKDRIYQNNRS